MKRIILTLAAALAVCVTAQAQSSVPKGFNYQGVVRTAAGAPMSNKTINLRLTIHEGHETGTVLYRETHKTTTNNFGLYRVVVGNGTATVGNFKMSDWIATTSDIFMQVEVDETALDKDYVSIGSTQLMSVPFAMFAANGPVGPPGPVGPAGPGSVTSLTVGGGLKGTPSTITTTGSIDLPNIGTPGTYGSASDVPQITTDAYGRVTSVTNVPIPSDNWGTQTVVTDGTLVGDGTTTSPLGLSNFGASSGQVLQWSGTAWVPVTATGTGTVTSITTAAPLTGGPITTSGMIGLAASGVTATSYGSTSSVPAFTVDMYGRLTAASNNNLSIAGDVTGTNAASTVAQIQGRPVAATAPATGQNLQWNGTSWTPTTGLSATGTANYIPMFSSPTAFANSNLYQNTNMIGIGTTAPKAMLHALSTTDSMVGWFRTNAAAPATNHGLMQIEYGAATDGFTALNANAINVLSNNATYGTETYGTAMGLLSQAATSRITATSAVKGIEGDGFCDGNFSMGVGAYGFNNTGTPTTTYGLYADAGGGVTNWSGWFNGNVNIQGNLNVVGTKSFRIDHPQDPANKYLYHSCVESNEMMNMYNGNVTTDASGVATVALPSYFQALNKDFRYQLTVIGTFAQAIVSKEIAGNSFEIKTSVPNVKVSWQVTGVRNDAGAQAHPMIAEVEKEAANKGKYLDAKAYGKPRTEQIGDDGSYYGKKGSRTNKQD